jgi:hypothetical protein
MAASGVPFVEPSSTTKISLTSGDWLASQMTESKFAPSLWVGMTTLIMGFSFPPPYPPGPTADHPEKTPDCVNFA